MIYPSRILPLVAIFASVGAARLFSAEPYETHRDLVYAERGDTKLRADVYVPAGEGPFPGILMVHGGAWVSGDKWHMAGHAKEAARSGYSVATITYRLAPTHKFPAQIEDCQEAVRWFRENAAKFKLDTERLAGYGYSAGAHLACLLGAARDARGPKDASSPEDAPSTRLQAVVAGGAPCDFRDLPPRSSAFSFFFGGTPAEKPELYRLGSPANFVSAEYPPTFFFHGETDSLVPRRNVEEMKKKLDAAGVKCDFYLVPEKSHLGAFLDGGASKKALEFLDQVLKSEAQKE